jgi:hypothetical protein
LIIATSDSDADNGERHDSESNQLEPVHCENEFGDTQLEELMKIEGPQEILQLIIQEQSDYFMKRRLLMLMIMLIGFNGCLMLSKGNRSSLQLRNKKMHLCCCNSSRWMVMSFPISLRRNYQYLTTANRLKVGRDQPEDTS